MRIPRSALPILHTVTTLNVYTYILHFKLHFSCILLSGQEFQILVPVLLARFILSTSHTPPVP